MADQVAIQVRFRIDRDGLSLSDALYFSQEEWASLTPEDVDALKEERYSAWISARTAAINEPGDPSSDLEVT